MVRKSSSNRACVENRFYTKYDDIHEIKCNVILSELYFFSIKRQQFDYFKQTVIAKNTSSVGIIFLSQPVYVASAYVCAPV